MSPVKSRATMGMPIGIVFPDLPGTNTGHVPECGVVAYSGVQQSNPYPLAQSWVGLRDPEGMMPPPQMFPGNSIGGQFTVTFFGRRIDLDTPVTRERCNRQALDVGWFNSELDLTCVVSQLFVRVRRVFIAEKYRDDRTGNCLPAALLRTNIELLGLRLRSRNQSLRGIMRNLGFYSN